MRTYLRSLSRFLKVSSGLSALILLILAIQALLVLAFQISYKEIFDGVAESKGLHFIIFWIEIVLIAAVLRVVVWVTADFFLAKWSHTIFGSLRIRLFNHLQWLPAGFFQATQMGDIISRYSHDLQLVEVTTRDFFPMFIRSICAAVFSLIALFYFQWQLTLFALCLFPFVSLGAWLFTKRAQKATRQSQVAAAQLTSLTEQAVRQHFLLQAFNLQKDFKKRFREQLNIYEKEYVQGSFLRNLVGRSTFFGLSFAEIVVFSIGALMTYKGMMTIGTLFGFFALIWNISASVSIFSNMVPNFLLAGVAMERLQEIFSQKTDEIPPEAVEANAACPSFEEGISFKNCSLKHGEKTILENLNIEIPSGQNVALVGTTGAGKTSILTMLLGFYPPAEGKLLIGNTEIQSINRQSLRQEIGVVFQHSSLFNLSIRENIRIGRLDASNAEVEEAAKEAEIHDFIVSLPEGYDTLIKEYGANLSGGQQQRIALARVALRKPSLLLLDEPTSALDLIVESQINENIMRLAKGRTMLISTHRTALLKQMDQILVLEQGKVVESGKHEELLKAKGAYHRLWTKQHGVTLKGEKPRIDLAFLHSIPIFQKLDESELSKLTELFHVEFRSAGETIFEKGVFGDQFYLIVKGSVEVLDPDLPLSSRLVAVLEEGDYFGEIALLKSKPRTHTIATRSYCVLLTLHASQFEKIAGKLFRDSR